MGPGTLGKTAVGKHSFYLCFTQCQLFFFFCLNLGCRCFSVNFLIVSDFCLYHCFSLSRFGKKKEEKKEAKTALQRQKSDILSDHELERMKDERER